MVQLGKINRLMVVEKQPGRLYLDAGTQGRLALRIQEAPDSCEVGSMVDVFLYSDAEGNLIPTTQKPIVTVGEFAKLKVTSIQKVGAFLDWGLPKELFLPFREQTRELRVGDHAIVYVYLDSSQRISASMRIEKHLQTASGNYFEGLKVELIVFSATELGYKAIINGSHLGMLYKNEIYQEVPFGQKIEGYIQRVREDGKIDLSLLPSGYRGVKDFGQKLLDLLEKNGGFLAVTDKSSAEVIHNLIGLSKKKYKMTVGTLYKKKLINIEENGIRLLPTAKKPKT
jgi:predicted RNA-binding protein (virulence factor B family)